MKQKNNLYTLVTLLIITSSCVNLEHINSFSKTAVETIGTYKDAGYSFTYSFYHFTQTSGVYNVGGTAPGNIPVPALVTAAEEPQTAIAADAVINTFITGISAYFAGIAKISDKDLLNYNFDEIGKNLKADNALRVKLNLTAANKGDEKIDAITKISKIFTTEMTGVYRQKKVKEIMIKYDPFLSLSIDALTEMLDKCLLNVATNDQGLIDAKYTILLADPKLEYSKKVDLMKECLDEKLMLEKSKQQIIKISEALKKMKESHIAIVTQLKIGKISSEEAVALVQKYASEIFNIYYTIKSIQ